MTAASWPTTALATSVRTAASRSRAASWARLRAARCGACSVMGGVPLSRVRPVVGQPGQVGVGRARGGASRSCTSAGSDRCARRVAHEPVAVGGGQAEAGRRAARGGGRRMPAACGAVAAPGGRAGRAPAVDSTALTTTGSGSSRAVRAGGRATASWPAPRRQQPEGGTSPRGRRPQASRRRREAVGSGTYHTSRSRWPSSRSATAALSARRPGRWSRSPAPRSTRPSPAEASAQPPVPGKQPAVVA